MCEQNLPEETYTVTFNSDGGSVVESAVVNDGEKVKKPEDPTKDGYTFKGWFNGEAEYDWTQPVTSNLSLTAKWTAVEYTITYLPDGVETDNPTTYTIETETFELKAPTKAPDATKPNFIAWHKGEKPAECDWIIVDSNEKGTTGNLTIVAEFSDKEQITITINKGDLTVTRSIDKGSSFKGETGYDFFEDEAFKTKFDLATVLDADKTLYAQVKTYTVTFDSGVTSQTIKYNGKATEPTAPTKDGYDFVGWYEGDTKFDFDTKITKDISLTAKWEEKKATEPEVPNDALTTTFKFDETYSGKVTYQMVENSGFGNATASEAIFNIDLSEQTLKTKDVVKLTFKITESSSDAINSLGYQSQIDNWGWHSINVKELGSTYNLSFEVGETTEFEGNLVGIKLTPQDIDGLLIGKDLVIKIEDLSVTLVPYVEGAEKDFWTADTAEGYDFGLECDYSKGIGIDASSLQAGNILTFYYTLTEVENKWGVYSQLKLAAGYSAQVLPSATDVGANEYGQINVAGTSFSYELTEADITAFAAESKDYKRK